MLSIVKWNLPTTYIQLMKHQWQWFDVCSTYYPPTNVKTTSFFVLLQWIFYLFYDRPWFGLQTCLYVATSISWSSGS